MPYDASIIDHWEDCLFLSLFKSASLVPRPVRAIRVTRGGFEPSAIAQGVLGEFSQQA